jgi:hypothetical protein
MGHLRGCMQLEALGACDSGTLLTPVAVCPGLTSGKIADC